MAREFFIGRDPELEKRYPGSSIVVPPACNAVSSLHARITIDDYGRWMLEDLNSANGTYIKDDEGEFMRISRGYITESTVIRFGTGGHHSHVMWAHRVVARQDDYSYEFMSLKQALAASQQEEEKLMARQKTESWLVSWSGAAAMAIMLLFMIPRLKDGGSFSGGDMIMRMSITSLLPPLVKSLIGLRGTANKIKKMREVRAKTMRCPKCGRPLQSFDLDQFQCSSCKAK